MTDIKNEPDPSRADGSVTGQAPQNIDAAVPESVPVRWYRSRMFRRLRRNRAAVASAIVIVVLILIAIASVVLPITPNAVLLVDRLQPPSPAHLLGTDSLGRDVLSRLIDATRVDIFAATLAVLIGLVIAVPLGTMAGYFGGANDAIVSRVIDSLMTLPPLILAIVIVGILGPGLTNAMIAIGILLVPSIYRVVRAATQTARTELYIESARAIGASTFRILWRHIFPAVLPPLLVQITFAASVAIIAEASLTFLGVGASPPQATWGLMLREAASNMTTAPYLLYPPAIVVSLTILTLSTLGDGLRDALGRQIGDGQ
jgi:peptide/nickel transport system permease protein